MEHEQYVTFDDDDDDDDFCFISDKSVNYFKSVSKKKKNK